MKKYLPDIICVVLFLIISVVYFYPADKDGRRLNQHDNGAADGLGVELNQYRDAHDGETPRWINSIFGGMPTYQIAPSYDSTKGLTFLEQIYHLWLPDYVFYIFISMLGFYILLRAFDFREWMAALGAIVWAFSSYFFIIIAAGHIWKVLTLAYIPPTIAGMVLCYKKKYLLGLALTALFASMQIISNHVQMTYYFIIPELLMVVAFLIDAIIKKEMMAWAKGSACVLVAAMIAVGINSSNLYHTYEYAKDTMRGKSELVKAGKTEDQTDSGLERSYITAWSYGIGETWSLLVPNIKGGASVPLSMNKTAMKKADPQLEQGGIYGAFTQYWGEQPGTSGPVYVGALVCMLFLMALFIVPNKNPMKWALLIATILSILLSWGKNFMPFTDWFIDNVPMYSKFRTVSSILVVAEFTIPLLAMMGLKEVLQGFKGPEGSRVQGVPGGKMKALYWSAGITVVICLLFAISPSSFFGDLVSSHDKEAVAGYVAQGYFDEMTGQRILMSIGTMREAMLSADAWRSVGIILIGAFIILLMINGKMKKWGGVLLVGLCLIDMWGVNKRYLYDSMFEEPTSKMGVQKTPAYEHILAQSGGGRNYRVMNLTVSTFNDNTTSYFFSSIGGYHAAKLRRYQELIETHIQKEVNGVFAYLNQVDTLKTPDELFPVINMLNTRWFILAGRDNMQIPVENPAAMGNAWFVDDVVEVTNANEEIEYLDKVSPRRVAIVGKDFAGKLPSTGSPSTCSGTGTEFKSSRVQGVEEDSLRSVVQTSLTSDEVKYSVNSKNGGVVVFSEIYYPGWEATIDGTPADIVRADYVLRAMNVPAGNHEIVMQFRPKSVATTETIAYICFALLIISLLLAIVKGARGSRDSRSSRVQEIKQ